MAINESQFQIIRFDHIQLSMTVDGLDKARAFYKNILGFDEIPNPGSIGGVWFSAGEIEIHLGVNPSFIPNHHSHIAFKTKGLDALVNLFYKSNLIFEQRIFDHYKRVYIKDPFNNRLEFFESY